MKKTLYIIILIICGLDLQAQITLNASILPAVGDTISVITNANAGSAGITAAGEGQFWDLSGLGTGPIQQTIFTDPSEGSQNSAFPDATLAVLPGGNSETYFKVQNGRLYNLGFAGMDPAGLGLQIRATYDPPLQEIKTPLTYGSELAYTAKLSLPFSSDELPDTLINMLPIQFDSIRLKTETAISDVVDAWGQIKTPAGTFEVLRIHRTDVTTTGVEIKVGVFPWVDISSLIPIPGLAGTTTTVSYIYQSNVVKAPIAEITADSTGTSALRTAYYANDMLLSAAYAGASKAGISIFPNPSYGEVNFNLTGLPAGRYTIKIFNIVGKEEMSVSDFVNVNGVIMADLSSFAKGTYIYSLINDEGKVIATKRLMVVTP